MGRATHARRLDHVPSIESARTILRCLKDAGVTFVASLPTSLKLSLNS